MNTVEELRQYKELLDSGIITQEEFDKKKSELLSASSKQDEPAEKRPLSVLNNRTIILALILLLVAGIGVGVLIKNKEKKSSSERGDSYSASYNKTYSMSERKKIAEEAVAEYIYKEFVRMGNSGKYSVIDYSKMAYDAKATASKGNTFDVSIDIYHYNSNGKKVGKNKLEIKASAEVDEYGKVSNVKALDFLPVEWD